MTIKNFTFFSPNSTEFPVGSNNDAKLYMMLTGMDYGTIRRKNWLNPTNIALNIQYANTSIIAGGRYFELLDETVALKGNAVNYIHANIDLTQTTNPVSLSAETANNSNHVDINNDHGVLKVCFDIIKTSGTGVTSIEPIAQTSIFDSVNSKNISANDISLTGSLNVPTQKLTVHTTNGLILKFTKKNDLVIVEFAGEVILTATGLMMGGTWVAGPYCPSVTQSLVGHLAGSGDSFHVDINPDGSIIWWGPYVGHNPVTPRGNASYFIK
ncbi:MAG: hypothetical protein ACLTIH_10000 [Eubacterium sp.]